MAAMNNTPKPSNEFVKMVADAQKIALLLSTYKAHKASNGNIENTTQQGGKHEGKQHE